MQFDLSERRKYALAVNDLLICEGGEVGRTAIWRGELDECYIQNAVHRVRPQTGRDTPRFLYYVMYTAAHIGAFEAEGNRSTIVHLTAEKLKTHRFTYPPLAEQLAIVAFLDRETARLDALVAAKERLIALLQEKRAALISHAVTRGLNPDVAIKDSGVTWLGQIPAHWEVKRLKHIATILRGKFSHRPRNDPRMNDGMFPFIQTGDISSVGKYLTNYTQTLNEDGFAVSKEFPAGTLVMSIAANIGDVAILSFQACFPDSIVGFVPASQVDVDFLYYNLTGMKDELMSAAVLNTQLNLNVDRIGSLLTTCPPVNEQSTIAAFLDRKTSKLDALESKVRQHIDKLKEYRAALISAAVTGKIDVRGEEVAE